MYPHQDEVLLIAIAGFWWVYCILPRKESKIATAEEVAAAEEEEVNTEPDLLEQHEIPTGTQDGAVDMVVESDLDRDEQDLSGFPSIFHGLDNVTFRDQISDKVVLHLLMTQTNFSLSTVWSPPLLFDTPPSNQALYLIHQRLEMIISHGYNGTKG